MCVCVCHANACFCKLLLKWEEQRWKLLLVRGEQKSLFFLLLCEKLRVWLLSPPVVCMQSWLLDTTALCLFWFPWEIQRIVERFIVIQQFVCLLLSSSPDQKMQGHSVLWTSFSVDILHTNLLALKSRGKEEQSVKSSSRFCACNSRKKWAKEAFQAIALLWSEKSVPSVFMYEKNKKE